MIVLAIPYSSNILLAIKDNFQSRQMSMHDDALHRYTEAEYEADFACLFPHGFADPDVLDGMAPEG